MHDPERVVLCVYTVNTTILSVKQKITTPGLPSLTRRALHSVLKVEDFIRKITLDTVTKFFISFLFVRFPPGQDNLRCVVYYDITTGANMEETQAINEEL